MTQSKRKQKIPITKLNNVLEQLGDLNKKQKSELNLRESIYYLRHKLKRALKQGYTYLDLVQILSEQNITISPTTLKQYLSDALKTSRAKRKQINSVSDQELPTRSNSSQDSTQNKTLKPKKLKRSKQGDYKKSPSTTKTVAESSDINESIEKNTPSQSEPSKTKTTVLSGSHQDLSNEFNQY